MTRAEKKNALSIRLRDEMSDALDRLAADTACRVVVITGDGDVFSAGFDLDEFTKPELGSSSGHRATAGTGPCSSSRSRRLPR